MAEMNLQEQFELPLVKDLITENDKLRESSNLQTGTKIPDDKIKNIEIPYRVKNKLLMKAGEFNGVTYPKEEIINVIELANEKGLVYDHLDTQNQGASNWVGQVENAVWNDTGEDGPGMYADLVIVDKPCAQKLAAGSKWGISPTIDYEKNELNGKIIGTDLLWKSFSFVLDPAVRDTMLNSKQEADKMSDEKLKKIEAELAELKKKKYPYPEKKVEKIKKDEEEMSLDVDEQTLALLKAKDEEIAELNKFKDKIEETKKALLVSELTANEYLIGRLSEDEIGDREKTLMEKSTEVLSELVDIVGNHAELSAYSAFVKAFMKKNKEATIGQAATAWKKQSNGKLEEEPAPAPAPAPEGEGEGNETQSLTSPGNPLQATAQLNNNGNVCDEDRAMHALMNKTGGSR